MAVQASEVPDVGLRARVVERDSRSYYCHTVVKFRRLLQTDLFWAPREPLGLIALAAKRVCCKLGERRFLRIK
jgi:hypothetical protein